VSGGSAYTDAQARAADPNYGPADHGYLAWSVDPAYAGSSTGLTTGVLNLIEVKVVATGTISVIDLNIASAGSLTNCYVALYNSAGNRLGCLPARRRRGTPAGMKSIRWGRRRR
jgi:hypothetical protein